MQRSAGLLLLSLLAGSACAQNNTETECDAAYECEYRAIDGSFYNLRPLCHLEPYRFTNHTTNSTFMFNVCGHIAANKGADCVPPYPVEYERGTAVQFFGNPPPEGQMCTNKAGKSVNCTRDCEVLGVGVPMLTPLDRNALNMGVNLTYYSVPSLPGDPFQCPFDPAVGANKERQVTIMVKCDHLATVPFVKRAYEESPCKYVVLLETKLGCGCTPNCLMSNCGSDGCGGHCGGFGHEGGCPKGFACVNNGFSQTCCKPDCRGRSCGEDGCGGSCGFCAPGFTCNRWQQCANPNASPIPLPSALPSTTIYTTKGSDYWGAFFGGIITIGAVGVATAWFMRIRKIKASGEF